MTKSPSETPAAPTPNLEGVAEAVCVSAPTPLAELMALDPLSLTRDDPRLLVLIEAFRVGRAGYEAGNKKAGSTKPKAAKAAKGATPKLDLGALGL